MADAMMTTRLHSTAVQPGLDSGWAPLSSRWYMNVSAMYERYHPNTYYPRFRTSQQVWTHPTMGGELGAKPLMCKARYCHGRGGVCSLLKRRKSTSTNYKELLTVYRLLTYNLPINLSNKVIHRFRNRQHGSTG